MEEGVGEDEDEDVASAQPEALITTLAHRIKRFRITYSKLGLRKCDLHRVYDWAHKVLSCAQS